MNLRALNREKQHQVDRGLTPGTSSLNTPWSNVSGELESVTGPLDFEQGNPASIALIALLRREPNSTICALPFRLAILQSALPVTLFLSQFSLRASERVCVRAVARHTNEDVALLLNKQTTQKEWKP